MDPIRAIVLNHIAGLRSSADVFAQQRADALTAADRAELQAAEAIAEANALEATLDEILPAVETPLS